jgi:hypothetical protein
MSGKRAKILRRAATSVNYDMSGAYYEKDNRTGVIRRRGVYALYRKFKTVWKREHRTIT